MSESYKVIVPYMRKGRLKHLSYPMRGHHEYTRDGAILLLREFERKRGKQYGSRLECWAESATERFTLQDIDAPETI